MDCFCGRIQLIRPLIEPHRLGKILLALSLAILLLLVVWIPAELGADSIQPASRPLQPANPQSTPIRLPLEQDVFKIEVNQDGIYELTYGMLQDAGMAVEQMDPKSFQMLYRGQPIAYQFVDDGEPSFSEGDRIRFYGWAYNGSRIEKQFITNNIFWLWADGTLTSTIAITQSVSGEPMESFPSSVTVGPDKHWFPGYTDAWNSFPNEPDAWFWEVFLLRPAKSPLTTTYAITLPHPLAVGPDAQLTAEISTWDGNTTVWHQANLSVNGNSPAGLLTWYGTRNVNITGTVPISFLLNGANQVAINYQVINNAYFALNRITADYRRQFVADNDTIIFSDDGGGQREFRIRGFSQLDPGKIVVWDITDRHSPVEINKETVQISGTDQSYTYTFGTQKSDKSTFITTVEEQLLVPLSVTRIISQDLEPAEGKGRWLAIAFDDFVDESTRLANHRSDSRYGGLSTHVVAVSEVINQYGFGLPTPEAIKAYLIHALTTWDESPAYLTLVGDATIDPRHIRADWTDPQFLLTDLVFVDRWQGQIPSDFGLSLLLGDDMLPDLAVGRLPAKTVPELKAIIDKIILYEENQQMWSFSWMKNVTFVSDDYDNGVSFCTETENAYIKQLPESVQPVHFCLDDAQYFHDPNLLRADLLGFINSSGPGATILNYVGHGAVNSWADPLPNVDGAIMETRFIPEWENYAKPLVILTANCLDGNFAYPRFQGLGEELLRAAGVGGAAHWGSSGLGLPNEHAILIQGFYEGLFDQGFTAIGDAVNYAKFRYYLSGNHPSLLYSFVLSGDPAMQLYRSELSLEMSASKSIVRPGDSLFFRINVSNNGVYPSHVIITNTLPAIFTNPLIESTVPFSMTTIGSELTFDLQFGEDLRNKGLPRAATAVITITVQVSDTANPGTVSNRARASGTGLDTQPGNEQDQVKVAIVKAVSHLPIIQKN